MVSSCRLTPAWAASALEVRWDSGLATSESQGPREVSSTGDCGLWGGGGSPGDLCGNDVSKVCSRLAIQGGLTLGLSSASGFFKNHLKLKRNNPVPPCTACPPGAN